MARSGARRDGTTRNGSRLSGENLDSQDFAVYSDSPVYSDSAVYSDFAVYSLRYLQSQCHHDRRVPFGCVAFQDITMLLRAIADRISATTFEGLPNEAVATAREGILDTIGVTLAGA